MDSSREGTILSSLMSRCPNNFALYVFLLWKILFKRYVVIASAETASWSILGTKILLI